MSNFARGHQLKNPRKKSSRVLRVGSRSELGEAFIRGQISKAVPRNIPNFGSQYKWRRKLFSRIRNIDAVGGLTLIGSWSHGTAIADYSDWDFIVKLGGACPASSGEAMEKLFRTLQLDSERFALVDLDMPAICIRDPFDGSTIDLVPAYDGSGGDYLIPSLSDASWMLSNPMAHLAFLSSVHKENWWVRKYIMLLKRWKYANTIPISSLYLEMVVAQFCLSRQSDSVLADMIEILRVLCVTQLSDLVDPTSASPRCISALNSDLVEKSDIISKITKSIELLWLIQAADKSGSAADIARYSSELYPPGGEHIYNAKLPAYLTVYKKRRVTPRYSG
ncbi:hypothetical protein [Rhodococcus opacus]|uniref:hypothetical protein n=1 Tax=Rhodococcus opacus TaxID=37919 RepID=UPI001F58A206|nr:hypothetical protein [Rhodococcus opacus]UNN05013.1 hypothetical protein MOO23_39305 [Rhodococcus opacus]